MKKIIKKFKKFNSKEENKELLVHSIMSLFIRGIAAVIAFLMNVVVSRKLGADEAGYFFLAVAFTTITASIGRIGADNTVLRFVSVHGAKQEWAQVNAVMRRMMSWTYIPLIILAVVGCAFSKQISIYCFHKEQLQWPLFWTCAAMPFFGGYNVHGMALQGRRKVLLSVTNLRVLTPFFVILFTLIFNNEKATMVAFFYFVACIINYLIGLFWWKKNVPHTDEKVVYDKKILWDSCWPLWISAVSQQMSLWGGQFVAGIYLKSDEVAQLATGRTTATLVSFVLIAVNNVSSTRFAAMYDEGRMDELKKYAINSTRVMTLLSTPVILVMLIFPHQIMSLFGKGFEGGALPLQILAIGQYISVITGNVTQLLNMSGHEKDLKNLKLFNVIFALAMAFILTPLYGVVGSAVSSALAMATLNLLAVGYVKKRLGFNTMNMFGFK